MNKIALGTLAMVLLSGCGGSSGGSSSLASSARPLGLWQFDDTSQQYVNFQSSHVPLTYHNDSVNNCFVAFEQPALGTDRVMNFSLTDLKGTFNFRYLESDTIEISNDDVTAQLKRNTNIPLTTFDALCGDSAVTESIKVDIAFNTLPQSIAVNGVNTQENNPEYNVSIYFDMNGSGDVDSGDLSFLVGHFKESDSQPSNKTITELVSTLHRQLSNDNSFSLSPVNVSQSGNTITFDVPVSLHSSLENISNGTPIFVRATHPIAEGGAKSDCYPNDCGYSEGLDTSTALSDQIGEASSLNSIVDIKSVQIEIAD